MNTYSTGMIRRELESIKGSPICNETWGSWRKAIGVTGHKCTYEQWIWFCAAFALYCNNKRVSYLNIKIFIREHGDDPMSYLPGLMPIDTPMTIPGKCFGRDLPGVIWNWLGIARSEDTISGWCKAAKLPYGRGLEYGRDELLAIACQARRARFNTRKGKNNLPKRKQGVKAA